MLPLQLSVKSIKVSSAGAASDFIEPQCRVCGKIVWSETGNSNCKRPQNPRHQSDQSHKVLGDGKTKNEMLFSVKIARGLQNKNQNYSL